MRPAIKIAAAALVVVPVLVVLALSSKTSAQQPTRFQVHADESIWGGYTKISAVCDTGNGAMIYVVHAQDPLGGQLVVSTTSVPNGCAKTPAEKGR